MRPTTPHLVLLLATALLAACQAAPQAPAPFPGMTPGKGAIAVAPSVVRGGARQLLAVVSPWTEAHIDHLVVKLYDPTDLVTPAQTVSVDADAIYNAITFSNLDRNKTYRVTADAYKAPGEAAGDLISNPGSSFVEIPVTTDDRPAMGNLVVDLADVTFSGLATTPGLTVTPGVLVPAGPEGARQLDPLSFDQAQTLAAVGGEGVAVDRDGDVFVTHPATNRIFRIPGGTGTPEVFAGDDLAASESTDGTGTGAHFNRPRGITIGPDDTLYVGDQGALRRVTNPGAVVTTLAGHPTAEGDEPNNYTFQPFDQPLDARFRGVSGIVREASGDLVFTDTGNDKLRRLSPEGIVSNESGPYLSDPHGLARGRDGKYYATSPSDGVVYRVPSTGASPTVYAGRDKLSGHTDGPLGTGRLTSPRGLAFDAAGHLFVATDRLIRKVDPRGTLSTVAGSSEADGDADGSLWQDPGDAGQTRFTTPTGLAIAGSALYFTDPGSARFGALKQTP